MQRVPVGLPMVKLFWFKGEATKGLVVSEIQKKVNGSSVEIVGLITNSGSNKFSSVTIEAEFFDAAGNFLDEESEYMRSDIPGGAKEHFKITLKTPLSQANAPDTKMVVKVTGGHSMPFERMGAKPFCALVDKRRVAGMIAV